MKVYVSCPMVVPQTTLDEILKELNASNDILASAHARGGMYTTRNLEESEAIVIVHPDNKFKFNQRTLPNHILQAQNRRNTLNAIKQKLPNGFKPTINKTVGTTKMIGQSALRAVVNQLQ